MAIQNEHGITWCERTWNPVTGCTPVSEGCKNCYAKRQALRLQKMGVAKYAQGFKPMFHPAALNDITPRQKPKLYFVCSMADLFHDDISFSEIAAICDQIALCPQHRLMMLTKRSMRLLAFANWLQIVSAHLWPLPNVALGVTIENQRWMQRLYDLRDCPAAYRYLSIEPMLGPVDLDAADPEWHTYIDLVICGGESGPGARPMDTEWVRNLRDQCANAGVAFHFKQWGGVKKRKAGRLLDGVEHNGSIPWRT